MPSARDILGDDAIDILKKQGLNNVHIHDIGRRIWESKKEETTQKEKQELEASKIRETGSAMDKLKLLSQETFNSDSKVAQVAKGLASNFVRTGEIASAIQIPNVFTELGKLLPESVQSLTTPAQEVTTFPKQYSDLGQKLDEKKEETSRKDVTFARKMALEALDQKMQGAKTYGEYATTGIEKMVDVITHPSEWTVQGVTEGASAFDSWLSLGMGGIANKVASPFLKVALGTTAAGTENAIINSLGEGARAKGQGKSEDEIARATIQGGAAGFAMGAPLGGVGAVVSMKMNPDGTPMPKEDILDEGTFGVTDLADELSENPLMQKIKEENEKEYFNIANEEVTAFNSTVDKSLKDSIVRHTEIAKTAAKELANNPAMPHSQLKILINSKYAPTDEELMISNFINDGVPLENRFAGWNIVHALERSIQQPIKTPEEFALTLKEGGYIDEAVVALTEAYVQKDVSIAYNFINQKIQTKGAEYVTQRTQSTFTSKRNADGGVPLRETNIPGANEPRGDAAQGRSGDELSNQERIDTSFNNGERAVPNDGPDTPSTSEGSRLPTGDEPMGGQQATRSDVDVVSRPGGDAVVQPKDGDNLGATNTDDVGDARYVPKEELDTKKQSDAKEGTTDERNSNAMDGQGGDMAPSPKEDTPQNVDLRSREAVELSKAERKKINESVDAILAKKSEEITEADKDVLRQYTGNGGIESGTYGSLSEHYTPYETVRGVYDALERAGVPMQKALEPAVGSGNFVGHKPALDWTTIDIDPKAHAINKILYPNAKHYNTSFESFKGDGFDAIISNVPFIETRGAGAIKNRPDVKALHDFYFVSAVDKVKEGGVVSFVTSRGTMDKSDMKIRKELMEKSDIIGAYRLPEGIFSKNAHTDVGADIIFLQKRAEGVKAEGKQLANNEAFIKSSKTEDGIYLNDYFQKNPEKILGELEVGVNKQFGTKAYVVKGKADYSKMELGYHKEGAEEALHVKKEDIPTDSNDFWEYADSNGMEVHGLDTPGILMKDGRISVADARVEFSDIDGGAKLFKDITDTKEGAKIEMLSAIAKAGEANDAKLGSELIASYKKEFKVHPYTDKALVRLFHDIGESEKLAELGSYFDKAFLPAQIFDKRTKFEGSGKMDVSVDAPIQTRMMYHENNKGVVDIAKGGTYIKEGDLYNALDNGYSLSGKGQVQNDILYYSGNLYEKMKQVEGLMDVYKNDGIVLSKLEKQLLALEEALPPRRSIEEINVRGDEPWILQNGLEIYPLRKVERMINGGEQRVVEWKSPYGEVFDNYLNSKALVSMKKEESITSYRRRLREANEEVQSVLSQIKEKVLGNETLSRRIEEVYNTKFNGYVSPDYKKASYLIRDVLDELPKHITIEKEDIHTGEITNVPAPFSLRSNQIEWITRAVYEGKSINAHDVGGGKTLSGGVLAKALKEKGAVNKPLFVVPAKVIKNWEKEIKRAFPDAKIVNLFNLEKSTRAKKLYELGNNEADYVLISHEGFKELKLPQDVEMRYVDELMSENLKTEDLKGRALAIQEEKINKYKAILKKENMDKRITIDKLGIDAVFADEARAFKNIGVHSKLVNFKLGKPFGLSLDKNTGNVSLDSALAYDFRFKTRYISEKNNGRNVYMLDATPTPNKPMEIFTMLKHLDHKIFDEYGIYSDRDFANRYFEFGAKMNKKGQAENGLVYIKNAYELRSIMDRYVNRISMQEFKDKGIISLPDEKVNTHYFESSDESDMVFSSIRERLLEAKGDAEKRKFVMGIFSEGVSASTDPRAYQRAGIRDFIDPTPQNNKLEAVIDKVISKRAENARAGQIIFLDNAGHEQQAARDLDKDGGVYEATLEKNLHQEIKEKLIASGRFKPEEIAIISGKEITNTETGKEISGASGQKGAEMKQAIVNAYDKGAVKVIIGTTKGAGEGMNIQKFTTDIYHMDIPWTPAEIIQRNGRGVRFGNENSLVNTHYFFQAGTFDELMYRTITNKRGWNEALWDAKVKDKIEIVDEGSAMPKEEEFMLQMEKDPIKRRALELQIEYGRLEEEFQSVNEEGYFLKGKRDSLKRGIEVSKEEIVAFQERLKSDRPNKYLGELLESIAKAKDATKKAELQADYDYKIKNAKANIEKMIEAKQRRIKEQEAMLEKTHKDIENNKMDAADAGQRLSSFEEAHISADGKIKAEIAEELC